MEHVELFRGSMIQRAKEVDKSKEREVNLSSSKGRAQAAHPVRLRTLPALST